MVEPVGGAIEHAPQPGVVGATHRRRRDSRGRELDGDRRAGGRIGGTRERPGGVDVAGQQHGAPTRRGPLHDPRHHALALGGIAVPLVVVHDVPVEHGVAVRQQPVHRSQRAGPRQLDRVDDHAAGDDRPWPGHVEQALAQPRPLLVAEQRASGIVERRSFVVAGLAVSPDEPRVEEDELRQVADRDRPPRDLRVRLVAQPLRQPLLAGGGGRGSAHRPRPVARRVVVLGAVAPRVVTEVVVVPDRHHRVTQVQRLGIRIGAQLGEASAVVVLGDRRVRGIVGAWALLAGVLVDVVAEVQDEVDLPFGERPVDAERRDRVPSAARRADADALDVAGGQGAGASDRRQLLTGHEAVPVGGRRFEVVDVDDDGVVAIRPGRCAAGGDDVSELGIAGQQPRRPRHVLAEAGPQEDRGGGRVEGRDRVLKDAQRP